MEVSVNVKRFLICSCAVELDIKGKRESLEDDFVTALADFFFRYGGPVAHITRQPIDDRFYVLLANRASAQMALEQDAWTDLDLINSKDGQKMCSFSIMPLSVKLRNQTWVVGRHVGSEGRTVMVRTLSLETVVNGMKETFRRTPNFIAPSEPIYNAQELRATVLSAFVVHGNIHDVEIDRFSSPLTLKIEFASSSSVDKLFGRGPWSSSRGEWTMLTIDGLVLRCWRGGHVLPAALTTSERKSETWPQFCSRPDVEVPKFATSLSSTTRFALEIRRSASASKGAPTRNMQSRTIEATNHLPESDRSKQDDTSGPGVCAKQADPTSQVHSATKRSGDRNQVESKGGEANAMSLTQRESNESEAFEGRRHLEHEATTSKPQPRIYSNARPAQHNRPVSRQSERHGSGEMPSDGTPTGGGLPHVEGGAGSSSRSACTRAEESSCPVVEREVDREVALDCRAECEDVLLAPALIRSLKPYGRVEDLELASDTSTKTKFDSDGVGKQESTTAARFQLIVLNGHREWWDKNVVKARDGNFTVPAVTEGGNNVTCKFVWASQPVAETMPQQRELSSRMASEDTSSSEQSARSEHLDIDDSRKDTSSRYSASSRSLTRQNVQPRLSRARDESHYEAAQLGRPRHPAAPISTRKTNDYGPEAAVFGGKPSICEGPNRLSASVSPPPSPPMSPPPSPPMSPPPSPCEDQQSPGAQEHSHLEQHKQHAPFEEGYYQTEGVVAYGTARRNEGADAHSASTVAMATASRNLHSFGGASAAAPRHRNDYELQMQQQTHEQRQSVAPSRSLDEIGTKRERPTAILNYSGLQVFIREKLISDEKRARSVDATGVVFNSDSNDMDGVEDKELYDADMCRGDDHHNSVGSTTTNTPFERDTPLCVRFKKQEFPLRLSFIAGKDDLGPTVANKVVVLESRSKFCITEGGVPGLAVNSSAPATTSQKIAIELIKQRSTQACFVCRASSLESSLVPSPLPLLAYCRDRNCAVLAPSISNEGASPTELMLRLIPLCSDFASACD